MIQAWSWSGGCRIGLAVLLLAFALPVGASFAEKLVNPDTVAPEFRSAAEKRRTEQIKLFVCSKKADESKILRRDRAAFIGDCLDKATEQNVYSVQP